MNRSGIPYFEFGWNPCGFGCSRGCEGCWAKGMCGRMQCPDCKAFRVHFHPERLTGPDSPAGRTKPAVIGVQFTGDLFDAAREHSQAWQVFDAAMAAPQHTYVYLTQCASMMAGCTRNWLQDNGIERLPDNWLMGATVRDQTQLYDRLGHLWGVRGRLWLSLEPLRGHLDFAKAIAACGREAADQIEGVVIGADNRGNQPWDTDWARHIAAQAQAIGATVFVKQLWMWQCPDCRNPNWSEVAQTCTVCQAAADHMQRRLATYPGTFPADLRSRDLPWTMSSAAEAVPTGRQAMEDGKATT